jgi:proline-specific peptidase
LRPIEEVDMSSKKQEGRIAVPGGEVWYIRAEGDPAKAPLIGLHGGPGFTHDYLEVLLELAPERTVVLYDQLGSGRSAGPDDTALWNRGRFVEELDAVRDALGIERMHLLGHSWGGTLAASYAIAHPRRLAGLFLASPLIRTDRWLEACKDRLERLDPPWPEVIRQREAEGNLGAPDYQAATFAFYQRHFCRVVPWPDALVRSFLNMNAEVYGAMWGPTEFSCTGNLKDVNLEDLGEFRGPIQLSCGRHDEVDEAYLRELAARWPDTRLHVFPDSSHSVPQEEPQALLAVASSFFAQAERAAID